MSESVRIALLDDAPTIRAGFETIVVPRFDLELVGCAATEAEVWPLLRRGRPKVVVLGLAYGALKLCWEIRRRPDPPAALLYTSAPHDAVAVAGVIAGAGAVISKSSSIAELLQAIRTAAAYPSAVPLLPAALRRQAAARVDPADHPIIAMRLTGESVADIGKTLGLSAHAVHRRIAKILTRLEPITSAG